MTVRELIAKLLDCNMDAKIDVSDSDGGKWFAIDDVEGNTYSNFVSIVINMEEPK